MPLAAGDDFRAFGDRVCDVLFDLGDRLVVNQRPLLHAFVQPVADFQRFRSLGQFLNKGVIDPGLRQETIGADAGLA